MQYVILITLFSILSHTQPEGPTANGLPHRYADDEVHLIAPGLVSTTMGEYSPTFDPVRNELYFMRRTPGVFDYTIYRSELVDGAWTRPEIINISGQYRDAAPYLSPDGNTLLFDSRRPTPEDPSNAINLWQSRRTATGWSQPEFLAVPSQNTDEEPTVGQDEFGPAMDDSGQLYFYSFRQPYRGGARYVLPRPSDQSIRLDNSIPDPSDQTFVSYLYVSPDATFAVMEGRARGRRDTDLFCSCKQEDGSWTEAVEVPGVNTAANEGGPFVTADGAYLLFTSNRRTKEASSGNANLYLVSAGKLREQCQGKD